MMNYSRSTKKKDRFKAIIVSWISLFLIGCLIGGLAVGLTACSSNEKAEEDDPWSDTSNFYGTRDGRTFTDAGEMSMDWGAGDLDFIPLDVPLDEDIQEFTYYLSYGYYIDFSFVMALIERESSFKVDAASKTNDTGLMQINSCNHEWLSEKLGITDFNDPYQNIRAGLYILRNLFEKYDDPSKVLMAYNMGEYGASVLWEQGITETNYSKKILTRADEFEALLKGSTEND